MQHGTTRRSLALIGVLSALHPVGVVDAPASRPPVAVPASASAPLDVVSPSGSYRASTPDEVADFAGGIAARLHGEDGIPLPGDVYLLMAQAGSDAAARLYDGTAFRHDGGEHDDTRRSNLDAVALVEALTGEDVDPLDLTSAPAGGDSGGVAYALGYLDVSSGGGFTAELSVAATGRVHRDGYLEPIVAIVEKTAAAALAGADVLFTTSVPNESAIVDHAARLVGDMRWTPSPDTDLAEQRHWDRYRQWGADRSGGMDVVTVRHFGDVAAYLCGAGSVLACELVDELTSPVRTSTRA